MRAMNCSCILPGATNSLLNLASAQPGDAGDYSAVVANSVGTVTSAVATLTVLLPPAIVAQPTNQTVIAGSSADFSVVATGSGPLNYQWRFEGTEISGATNSLFSLADAQSGDAGGYSVVVANAAGSATSAVANLSVLVPPQLLSTPQSQRVLPGSTVTFSVTAGGTSPLSYQWRYNEQIIVGATSDTFSLTNVQPGIAGDYDVTVSNAAGSVTSPPAQLAVSLPPLLLAPRLVSGAVEFTLSGTPGDRYAVESSTNLFDWVTSTTVSNATGEVMFLDPAAAALPLKAYRGRLVE